MRNEQRYGLIADTRYLLLEDMRIADVVADCAKRVHPDLQPSEGRREFETEVEWAQRAWSLVLPGSQQAEAQKLRIHLGWTNEEVRDIMFTAIHCAGYMRKQAEGPILKGTSETLELNANMLFDLAFQWRQELTDPGGLRFPEMQDTL